MKQLLKRVILIGCWAFSAPIVSKAQPEPKTASLQIGYFMDPQKSVHLIATVKSKVDGKWTYLKGMPIKIYLDQITDSTRIQTASTDKTGQIKAFIPPSLKNTWDAQGTHTFYAEMEAANGYESATAEITVSKSRITIDTLNDGEIRNIVVKVETQKENQWVPAADVELKVGIHRSVGNSILPAGEDATYTTDSSGNATVEFKRLDLPGDEKGNLILMARAEENEQIGTVAAQFNAPWGKPTRLIDDFFSQRALWATRFRTPIWLLFMAYSIVIGVWGTIFYLIVQMIKIKKLGTATEVE